MGRQQHEIWWIVGICIILLVGALIIQWIKHGENIRRDKAPYNIVSTLKGNGQNSRAFTWFTVDPKAAGLVQIAEGTDPDKLNNTASQMTTFQAASSETTYTKDSRRGVHKAEVTGLKPGTTYVYRVGSGKEEEWSEAYTFTTEGELEDHFTFINVTDTQGETKADFTLWGRALDKAAATFPNARFIIHNGDLTEDPEDESAWDFFFEQTKGRLAQIPLMPVVGNHDEIDGNADRFVEHFNLPDNGDEGSIPGTSYSFDYGQVHFAVLNTESNIRGQLKWLEKNLQSTDQLWTIVAIHRPAYGGNSYDKIEKWIEIFDEYDVDLVLQGHNHEYSRSYPLRDGEIVNEGEGTVYVTTNAAGQKFNDMKSDKFYHAVHFQNYKQMFAGITVNGNVLTYQAYDVDGKKLDEFVLKK
ncbi:Alkaline phosphatase precursor [compost metagenome]